MRSDLLQSSKSSAKIDAAELLSVAGISQEGVVSAEIVERRRDELLADLNAFQEVVENPFVVVAQDLPSFERVFRAAVATTILEKEHPAKLNAKELIEKIHAGEAEITEQLNGSTEDLNEYFAIVEANQIINVVKDRKFESSFNLAKATRAFLKEKGQENGTAAIDALFAVLTGGAVHFNPTIVEKSWDNLQLHVKSPDNAIVVPHINELVGESPKLNALSLILFQKMGMYTGEPSPLVQPLLVAGFVCEPEKAAQYIAQGLGISVHNDSVDTAITLAVKNIQEGTITAEQLNGTSIGIGQRLLLVGYSDQTTELLLLKMRENCEINETVSVAATVDRGILILAGKMCEKVYPQEVGNKEEIIEKIIGNREVTGGVKQEELRARLGSYAQEELQGLLFFAITKDTRKLTHEIKEAIGVVFMNLLSEDIELDIPLEQAFGEVVLAAHGKLFEDISTLKYSEVVKRGHTASPYGIAELLTRFPASESMRQEDELLDAVAKLDQLGRYELVRLYLSRESFVIRSEFEKEVASIGEKQQVTFGLLNVSGSTGRWILEESTKRVPVAMPEFFVKSVNQMTSHELIWCATNATRALDEQISKIVISGLRTANLSTSNSKVLKKSANSKDVVGKLFDNGLPAEQELEVYKAALQALFEIDPDLFLDPTQLSDEEILKNAQQLTHIIRARTEGVISMILGRNEAFQVLSGMLPYRVCESEEERERKALIYSLLFDAKNFAREAKFTEVFEQIRKDVSPEITDEQLRQEVLIAVTNFAVFTRYEMDPAMIKIANAPSSMNSVLAYEQLLSIREAALKRVLKTREAAHIMQCTTRIEGISGAVEAVKQKVASCSADARLSNEFKQSLTVSTELITEFQKVKELSLAEQDKEAVDAIGMYLFPDFNKRQRRALALAFIAKWGEVTSVTVQNTVNEIETQQGRIVEIIALSAKVTELLSTVLEYDFNGIGDIASIPIHAHGPFGEYDTELLVGKGKPRVDFAAQVPVIQALPVLEKGKKLRDAEIPSRDNIVHQAKLILETAVTPERTTFEQEHKRHVPELYRTTADTAKTVIATADWAENVKIVAGAPNPELLRIAQVISQVTPQEIENSFGAKDIIVNGVGRTVQGLVDRLETNMQALRELPLMKSLANGGNADYILALTRILAGEDFEIDDEIAMDSRTLLGKNDSVRSIIFENGNSRDVNLDQIETILKQAESMLTELLPLPEVAAEPLVVVEDIAADDSTAKTELETSPETDQFEAARLRIATASKPKKKKKKGSEKVGQEEREERKSGAKKGKRIRVVEEDED